ncbi:12524_t:CDS:2, partial [Funneliformis caledonium]
MFESIANEFLQRTPVKDWSIISLLKYIESKSELSADMIEILREEIYSVLRGFSDDININVHGNAKKRAKKLLSNFDKLFSSGDVNNFIEELKLKEERREYYMAFRRKITSANSLQTLEEHHMTRRLIDDLRDADATASSALKRKSFYPLDDRAKKVTVVDNPFLLSNENKSDKFEILTESRNLDEEHNEKSVVTPRDDNLFLLSNENISDKFEIITESGYLDEEHNEKSVVTPRDDNPFLLSNENISDKFEIVTESGNLDK